MAGRQAARERKLSVSWMEWDLTKPLPPLGTFDVMLIFNYLDRPRMRDLLGFLRPGGVLIMETFLEDQRAFEWGPTSDAHLLQRGELPTLITPLQVLFGREVTPSHLELFFQNKLNHLYQQARYADLAEDPQVRAGGMFNNAARALMAAALWALV